MNRIFSRFWQLSAVRTGYCEREFIAFLKFASCDDLLAFDFCSIRHCFICVIELQVLSIIICYICTQRSIQVIRYLDPNLMNLRIIRYALSTSAFFYLIGIGLACILFGKFNLSKFERCLVTTDRMNSCCNRIWQFTTIPAGHCESKFVSRLELTACDDLLTFQLCCGRFCRISVSELQVRPVIIRFPCCKSSIVIFFNFYCYSMVIAVICDAVS